VRVIRYWLDFVLILLAHAVIWAVIGVLVYGRRSLYMSAKDLPYSEVAVILFCLSQGVVATIVRIIFPSPSAAPDSSPRE